MLRAQRVTVVARTGVQRDPESVGGLAMLVRVRLGGGVEGWTFVGRAELSRGCPSIARPVDLGPLADRLRRAQAHAYTRAGVQPSLDAALLGTFTSELAAADFDGDGTRESLVNETGVGRSGAVAVLHHDPRGWTGFDLEESFARGPLWQSFGGILGGQGVAVPNVRIQFGETRSSVHRCGRMLSDDTSGVRVYRWHPTGAFVELARVEDGEVEIDADDRAVVTDEWTRTRTPLRWNAAEFRFERVVPPLPFEPLGAACGAATR